MNIATYGHASDGNLHVTIQYRMRNFAETSDSKLPFYEETPDQDLGISSDHSTF